ncbi:MAG TPA: RimK family alpha-L-glutamate ligase [Candidatus Borkfalkia excrementigallinarum]|uniref:RimK family alpha-L-glutamate ligase n=1 Tax=Candidatus Borkfalkia excrementigallinarum TaxID=2838506 RepID=A0A9D1ZVP1_9FIRM|nr:RimK family alpha-L-glutamate ligase [Candidatus Borkfalkia excrementigallinarum]
MKGIVLVNAYIRSAGMIRQAERVAEELCSRGADVRIVKNGDFLAEVRKNDLFIAQNMDFAVYLDKDKYLPQVLESRGVRLFNSARAVELCDDKMLTYLALAGKGLNLPDTVAAPLCYYADAAVREDYLRSVAARLGFPLVVKKSFGSWGMDVRLVEDFSSLRTVAEEFKLFPHLYQMRVGKRGEDLRVLVVGGRVVACMRRKNEGDFRSNVEAGGKGSAAHPPEKFLKAALRCAEVLGLDYCGVDLLDEGGEPYVCEVNSNALFNEAERVTGANVAGAFAEHILARMRR